MGVPLRNPIKSGTYNFFTPYHPLEWRFAGVPSPRMASGQSTARLKIRFTGLRANGKFHVTEKFKLFHGTPCRRRVANNEKERKKKREREGASPRPEVNIIPVGASRCTPRPDNAAIVRGSGSHSSVRNGRDATKIFAMRPAGATAGAGAGREGLFFRFSGEVPTRSPRGSLCRGVRSYSPPWDASLENTAKASTRRSARYLAHLLGCTGAFASRKGAHSAAGPLRVRAFLKCLSRLSFFLVKRRIEHSRDYLYVKYVIFFTKNRLYRVFLSLFRFYILENVIDYIFLHKWNMSALCTNIVIRRL